MRLLLKIQNYFPPEEAMKKLREVVKNFLEEYQGEHASFLILYLY